MHSFPVYRQLDQMDCGPTCLRMVSRYYGRHYKLDTLRDLSYITRQGVSLKGISEAAEAIGFRTVGVKITFDQLDNDVPLPCILHWNQNHFVVLPPQNYDKNKKNKKILIADPAHGTLRVSLDIFLKSWVSTSDKYGLALLMEPTPLFYRKSSEKVGKEGVKFLFRYVTPYRKYFVQLFLGMVLGSLLSLAFPFLTQSLVDYGINGNNLNFIYLVLISQLVLFIGNTAIEVIRGWLLLHISVRVNISIISDFLIKLMHLPIRFFDTKMIGDITQRVYDHRRIEQFLTGASLNTLFSAINLIVFSIVLGIYSLKILLIFIVGACLSIAWITFFLQKRSELDYAHFQSMSDDRNTLFEIISGMQDIKLTNSETVHRWDWEKIQAKLFKLNIKSLGLEQYQLIGSTFFTKLKDILITFLAAKEVLNGEISLGMMLSISYISGQMNSPISQFLSFLKRAQDAKISLDRLREIHSQPDEEKDEEIKSAEEIKRILYNREGGNGIILKNISFRYGGPHSPLVLNGINLTIPFGKVTAIVGTSGSGKTTLMKILLRFYEPNTGEIFVGKTELKNLSPRLWRSYCGVVMQDGFIFSHTIKRNISLEENSSLNRLSFSTKLANIEEFINGLPLGYNTKIGNQGNGISSGQKQRLLISRAIYKNPKLLFLDEATNTLDANNEREIIDKFNMFFKGRTVIVIAHRLSTVKHADQIIVMENGRIVEVGNHKTLIVKRGKYYKLVKNQLELDA